MKMSADSSWVINFDECLRESADWWKRQCIYGIPDQVSGPDPKPYRPQVVSIGPLHYRAEPHLIPMQSTGKERALGYFLRRSKPSLDVYREILRGRLVEYLTSAYGAYVTDKICTGRMSVSTFLDLMIEDGCFLLEIMRVVGANNDLSKDIYARNDPIFMLLLENQVPFGLLEFLLAAVDVDFEANPDFHFREETRYAVLELIIKFFSLPDVSPKRIKPPYLHILDVYRKCLISQDFNKGIKHHYVSKHEDSIHFPSASKLYEAGVPFKRSFIWDLTDISFHRGTLRFPQIVITNDTISTLANLMAFERLHVGAGSEVTSYVFLLNCLIHNARDVSLLEYRGIIHNTLRDDEDVVKLFSFLSKDVVAPSDNRLEGVYRMVSQKLRRRRFRRRLNVWRIDLLQKYFNTPWGVLSVVAAIILFTLTTIQTVYTVLSYTHPNPK